MIHGLKKRKAEILLEIKELEKKPEVNYIKIISLNKRYEGIKNQLKRLKKK